MRPTTGMSESGQIATSCSPPMARLVQPASVPTRLVRPWQKNTIASPAMTWLTRSTTTSSANSNDTTAAASMATTSETRWIAAKLELGGDAGQRANEHEPFGAERENPGALADDQAECRQGIGRGKARRAGQPVDDELQHPFFLFNAPSGADAASGTPRRRRRSR